MFSTKLRKTIFFALLSTIFSTGLMAEGAIEEIDERKEAERKERIKEIIEKNVEEINEAAAEDIEEVFEATRKDVENGYYNIHKIEAQAKAYHSQSK